MMRKTLLSGSILLLALLPCSPTEAQEPQQSQASLQRSSPKKPASHPKLRQKPVPPDPPVTTAGGTVNVVPKFDKAADITNSQILDNGTNVGIGNPAPFAKLDVIATGMGVRGTTASSNSVGVLGQGSNRGLEGDTDLDGSVSILGDASSTSGGFNVGVAGQTHGSGGIGVQGLALATSGNTFGVSGAVNSPGGRGVAGFSFTGTCAGSINPCGVGVFGFGTVNGTGVYGRHVDSSGFLGSAGVWGDTGNSGFAILGTATDNSALAALNNSPGNATVFIGNAEASSNSGFILSVIGEHFGGLCIIDVSGNLTCNGAKHAAVAVDGGRTVALSAIESPENWFEDFGSSHLANGRASVALDPAFAQTVNASIDYRVFLTPNGDCKGLYVAQKTPNSFEVRELGRGRSNVPFDYRIVVRRKGYEKTRLEDVTDQMNKLNEQREIIKAKRLTVPPQEVPPAPTPFKPVLQPPPAAPKGK